MTVLDFDSAKVRPYLEQGIEGFLGDPPDTEFQRGYLAALICVYKEGLSNPRLQDARIVAAEAMLNR